MTKKMTLLELAHPLSKVAHPKSHTIAVVPADRRDAVIAKLIEMAAAAASVEEGVG